MLLEIAKKAALAGGTLLEQGFGKRQKLEGAISGDYSRSSLSTEYDKLSDSAIREVIKSHFHVELRYGIISEESGNFIVEGNEDRKANPNELRELEHVWVIDPLCGSTLYDRGIRDFAISISLLRNNEAILGIVYDPGHNELFYAEKDSGAFLLSLNKEKGDTKRIRISQVDAVERKFDTENRGALISIEHKMIREDRYREFVGEICKKMTRLRVAGTCGLELCYVACGRIDAMLRARQPIYDYAAGKIIVEEAGGQITDFRRNSIQMDPDKEKGEDIIASNGRIHQEVLDLLEDLVQV